MRDSYGIQSSNMMGRTQGSSAASNVDSPFKGYASGNITESEGIGAYGGRSKSNAERYAQQQNMVGAQEVVEPLKYQARKSEVASANKNAPFLQSYQNASPKGKKAKSKTKMAK